jgi:predicted P-loop ATPase
MERNYGITGKEKILDGVETTAKAHSFHPIREYLQATDWDGVKRAETLLIRYMGAEDTEYTRAVTRKTLVAAVARVFRPGIKFDYMLTIRGVQGIGKSSLLDRLAGDWFSDSFRTVDGKEAYEQVRRAWIIEVGELAGLKKAEVESIKLFISKREDQYRPAYGRQVEVFPRQCIFIGTTNEIEFLRDSTGGRRYWVVDTPNSKNRANFREELTDKVVAQIWAEAYHYYTQGEALYLPDELEAEAARIQAAYAETDDRAGMVQAYLDRLLPDGWEEKDLYDRREWLQSDAEGTRPRDKVCRMEIWCEVFGNQPGKIDRFEGKAIHTMLEAAGWRYASTRTFGSYGRQRAYVRAVSE